MLFADDLLSRVYSITAVSIVRLTTLADFYKNPADIDTYYPVAIWTVVELNVGVIVACMPAARLLIAKYGAIVLKSAKSSRASGSSRPNYSANSDPESYKKVVRNKKWASRMRLTLPTGLGGTRFVRSVNAELDDAVGGTRQDGSNLESQVELVDAKDKKYDCGKGDTGGASAV